MVLLSYHVDGVRDSCNNLESTKPYGITNQKTLIVLLIGARAPNLAGIKKTHLLLTYLLTPWCRVLLEKVSGLKLVKKFPTFHGTPRFITALTSVRHLSLF